MAGFSDTVELAVLNLVLKGTSYSPTATTHLSLHTADPGDTGANEVTGGSYARQAVTWGNASSGSSAMSSAQRDFTLMPACTVTHWAGWTASSGGTCTVSGTATNRTLLAGDTYSLTAATVSLD